MDVLTHLFLPIAVLYALWPTLFPSPLSLGLAVFAVVPDFDKLLGTPGLLHSVFAVGAVGGIAIAIERRYTGRMTYAMVIVLLLASHLLLDVIDGGPVTLLYPLVDAGVGLEYPTRIVFGDAVQDVTVRHPLPDVRVETPNAQREAYPLLNGYGILSALVFVVVYVGMHLRPVRNSDENW